MSRRLNVVAAVLIAGSTTATIGSCGTDGPGAEGPGGVLTVEELPQYSAELRFRIGGPDAPEPEAFRAVPEVTVAPDESVIALDRRANRAARFGPDGAFLNYIGRDGEGPGEFNVARWVGMIADTIWISNMSPPFTSFFLLDGTFVRTESFENPEIGRNGIPEGPRASLAANVSLMTGVVSFGVSGPVQVPVMIAGAGGVQRDTIATIVDGTDAISGMGINPQRPEPVPPLTTPAALGGHALVADWGSDSAPPGLLTVRIFRLTGELESVDTIALEPVPVRPAVRDSIITAIADSLQARRTRILGSGVTDRLELPDDLRGAIEDALSLSDHFAPIRAMVPGVDGTLWVDHILGAGDSEWIVLDADFAPLLRVRLPSGVRLVGASREAVWTTDVDDLDAPYLTRYDIVPG